MSQCLYSVLVLTAHNLTLRYKKPVQPVQLSCVSELEVCAGNLSWDKDKLFVPTSLCSCFNMGNMTSSHFSVSWNKKNQMSAQVDNLMATFSTCRNILAPLYYTQKLWQMEHFRKNIHSFISYLMSHFVNITGSLVKTQHVSGEPVEHSFVCNVIFVFTLRNTKTCYIVNYENFVRKLLFWTGVGPKTSAVCCFQMWTIKG